MGQLVSWARNHLLKWTAIVAIAVFVLGPFIQKFATVQLEKLLMGEDILIDACSPLRDASMVLTSRKDEQRKIHGAMPFSMMQSLSIAIQNNSDKPLQRATIYVAPLNDQGNCSTEQSHFH